jgi:hypothetical protein
MEIRGLNDDLPIYIPGGGHEWVETPNDMSKGDGTLIFDCGNCDSVLSLTFFASEKRIFRKRGKGRWICSVQRSPNCCKEPEYSSSVASAE